MLLLINQDSCRSICRRTTLKLCHILPTPLTLPRENISFPHLHKCLAGRRFLTKSALGTTIYWCFSHIPKNDFKGVFFNLADRLRCLVARTVEINSSEVKRCDAQFSVLVDAPLYNRNTRHNLSCLLQTLCHLSTNTKLSVS